MNYGTKRGHFLGYWKVILVHIRRWSHGTFKDDNNIFHKMKNDLTIGTWQDDIWCPINIICFALLMLVGVGQENFCPIWECWPKVIHGLFCIMLERKSALATPATLAAPPLPTLPVACLLHPILAVSTMWDLHEAMYAEKNFRLWTFQTLFRQIDSQLLAQSLKSCLTFIRDCPEKSSKWPSQKLKT